VRDDVLAQVLDEDDRVAVHRHDVHVGGPEGEVTVHLLSEPLPTIIAESGVAKATFYKHFPAKDDLVVAYLDRVDEVWTGQLRTAAAAAGPAPANQLVGLFDALGSACRREGYRGCGFINAAAESVPGTSAHERTVAHKQQVRGWMEGLARDAGAAHPEQLARALSLLLDGALANGALDADPGAVESARDTAALLVRAAVPA
jgi:AcrR family transcriptional regulator